MTSDRLSNDSRAAMISTTISPARNSILLGAVDENVFTVKIIGKSTGDRCLTRPSLAIEQHVWNCTFLQHATEHGLAVNWKNTIR